MLPVINENIFVLLFFSLHLHSGMVTQCTHSALISAYLGHIGQLARPGNNLFSSEGILIITKNGL